MKMTRAGYLATLACLLLGMSASAAAELRDQKVAGQFYPDEPKQLRELVEEFLAKEPEPSAAKPRALIVPHAGYQYSGLIAAHAYRQLEGRQYHGVVVVGFTHRMQFPFASVDTAEAYRTPLGELPVDQEAVAVLRTFPGFDYLPAAHEAGEHSLEVQLPFLQVAFDRVRIVPILMGTADPVVAGQVADGLAALARLNDYLFIFTTDLSHYHPYSEAQRLDEAAVNAILNETPQAVSRLFRGGEVEACGQGPIQAALFLSARLGYLRKELLSYANSGDTAGMPERVVGYAAIALYDPPPPAGERLSDEAGRALVTAARQTLDARIGGQPAAATDLSRHAELSRARGLFVTLRKRGELRGCIGRIEPEGSLASLLPEVAMDAALRDHRFAPVTAAELPELAVEVSVLSPPAMVNAPGEIVAGRDGVILAHEDHRGLFLPQVWEETGWTRIEFLRELARQKAGLRPEAWERATLYVFQDQVFEEEPARPGAAP